MSFEIRSGTSIREYVEPRPDAKSALQYAEELIRRRRPNVVVLDLVGKRVSLPTLRQLADKDGSIHSHVRRFK